MTDRTLIIAEAGVNHNGDMALAVELIDRAAECGADVVKFQTFNADRLASPKAPKAAYQARLTGAGESQLDMLRRLQLSVEDHRVLIERCRERGIAFLSTAAEIGSLRLLVEDLAQKTIKLGSGELTNAPLLLDLGRTDVDIILSTGMGTISEVEEALGVLAYGMTHPSGVPTRADFARVLTDPAVWPMLRRRVTLLHCTTEYPAAHGDTNLRVLDTLRAAFGLPVGYSDHCEGSAISLAAVARGAVMIEKHFTLDRTLPGPDHAASIEPKELAELVAGIRAIEVALGTGIKQPCAIEIANRAVARKSLMAARDLEAGAVLAEGDVTVMRPGDGVSPMDYWDMLGTRTSRAKAHGDLLDPIGR